MYCIVVCSCMYNVHVSIGTTHYTTTTPIIAAEGNHGCKGGLMDNAFRYLERYEDETELAYPYKAEVRLTTV